MQSPFNTDLIGENGVSRLGVDRLAAKNFRPQSCNLDLESHYCGASAAEFGSSLDRAKTHQCLPSPYFLARVYEYGFHQAAFEI
jgi:hypothetical protein